MSVKVLAVGSPQGALKDLFARVKAIDDKHGKFAFVLCVGDFFGPAENDDIAALLDGSLEPPLPLYIMQGAHAFPPAVIDKLSAGQQEIARNVTVLGKSAVVATPQGIRIGSCGGGKYDATAFKTTDKQEYTPYITSSAVDALLSHPTLASADANSQTLTEANGAQHTDVGLDILVTHLWPISISQHSPTAPALAEYIGNTAPPLDEVVRRTKPRYHFAASNPSRFWEREAFVWEEAGSATRATRFIGLGSFGEPEQPGVKKPRWFYAFSIASGTQTLPPKPARNPFVATQPTAKRPLEVEPTENFIWGNVAQPPPKRAKTDKTDRRPPAGYKCRICSSEEHYLKDCPDKPEKAPVPEGYVCNRCKGTDHLIRDCPKRFETGDTGGKKPREGYVCRACGSTEHLVDDCPVANAGRTERPPQGRRRGPPREIAPDECWFCLSNPRVTKHLIVSIGSECYLTLPKGQIPPTGSHGSSSVPGGGHVLIVPISHYPTMASVPSDLALPIVAEIEKYKSALRSLYAAHGAVPVIFEVSRLSGKGGHTHVQVVPVPNALADKVEDMFKTEGERMGIFFEESPSEALESARSSQENYFRVDLPDGRMMLHLLRQGSAPFNLQFGRGVLATLLGWPERVDWKACSQTEEEERADAQAFKKAFTSFDPMR
ncbi:nuclear protein [Exidia glandulosa HHB12029]|uniref:Nuclear protein n=1 Tax=Exidia glandulosa HHB12029 TaxID=1314781 RepID=A0A166AY61_EXIGL|nr:nuclear protein [Exidia glandulosa HHB12029]